MPRSLLAGAAGLAALLALGAGPAAAQYYGYDGDFGPPAGYAPGYAYGAPAYGYGYDEPMPYPRRGYYSAHRESYVGPYGYAHRRCRAHRACYEGY